MTYPLTIWTIRSQLENGYTIAQWCTQCRGWKDDVDLAGLVARGFGEKPARDLGLRCPACRTRVHLTVQTPSRHASGPVAAPTSDAAPRAP